MDMRRAGLLLLFALTINQLVYSQTTITGNITSIEDGLGVIGAAIVVKGTTIGTTADLDGNYKLTVPAGATTLVYSFVGLKSEEVQINGQTVINVILKTDVFKMEEVVVSGVASATPKRKLSVSVAKVSDELKDVPATSASSALQGKVAGVIIVSGNGNPGSSAGIRLRGSNSLLEGQSPLILVDGVMFEGDLADINADDIESMEVVKGASASALYGSKAGSGVIVVNTKRGKLNEEASTDIRVRNEYGVSGLVKKIKLAEHHPYQISDNYKENGFTRYTGVTYPNGYTGGKDERISGQRVLDIDQYADNPYSFVNDPQDEIFLSGNYYTNYVSLASNSKKTAYFTSIENNHNSGIVFNAKGSSRQNFRVNVDHKITDDLKISTSTLFSQNEIDMPASDGDEDAAGGQSSPFFNLLVMSPDVNLNMASPDSMTLKKYFYKPDQWGNGENPKHALYYQKRTQKRRDLITNISANWNAAKWINFDVDYSFEKQNTNFTKITPVGFQGGNMSTTKGYAYKSAYDFSSQTLQTTANLQGKFGDLVTKGKLSYLYEEYNTEYFAASGNEMMASGVTSLNNLRNKSTFSIGSGKALIVAKDFFGILDMDFKEKYIASILYRYDGSSLFGKNNRWNPYYRVSVAYRINEDLHLPGIQELKLRAAVGTSGQRPAFYYQYESYPISTNAAIILAGGTSANANIKPADTREIELGMNMTFLDKFEMEVVRSMSTTKGIFFQKRLPAVTGFSNIWWNAATSESNSWELTLGAQLIKTSHFEWHSNITFDRVRQKITDLDALSLQVGPVINGNQLFTIQKNSVIGEVMGHTWVTSLKQMEKQLPSGKTINDFVVNSDGYVIEKGTEGRTTEKPILLDQDKDGVGDIIKIGDFNPDFNLSWSSRFSYKNLGMSMLWVWKQGGSVYNMTKQWIYLDLRHGDIDQSSKPEYKRKAIGYYTTFYDNLALNKYFIEDGSYLKLRELSLYYNMPSSMFKGKSSIIKGGKLGILGRNLLTFTKYTGWDPEVGTSDSRGAGGTSYIIDLFNYPNYRTYSVSLELNF